MKKLLANVSNYAYNKMAKMAYYWYWLGVSSVCVKMPKISVAGEKNSSKSQATQCYPLFASLLGGWVGSYRSQNQNLWAMLLSSKDLLLSVGWCYQRSVLTRRTDGTEHVLILSGSVSLVYEWVTTRKPRQRLQLKPSLPQGRDLLSTRIFDKSEMGAGCGIFGNKWYNFFF